MRLATALLIPGLRALANQLDSLVSLLLWHGAREAHRLLTREVVPALGDRVHATGGAEEVRIGVLVPHDAAGNGGDIRLILESSTALNAMHVRSACAYDVPSSRSCPEARGRDVDGTITPKRPQDLARRGAGKKKPG